MGATRSRVSENRANSARIVSIRRPMIDTKLLRDNPEAIAKSLQRRGGDIEVGKRLDTAGQQLRFPCHG